jgi:aspartate kinase
MKVFKFGGASVKNGEAVKNIGNILNSYSGNDLVIIISAMGKMTNAFEWLINSYCYAEDEVKQALNDIVDYHNEILWELFPDKSEKIYVAVNEFYFQLEEILTEDYSGDYDKTYDSLIGFGELISTKIVSAYLQETEINNSWLDARELVKTDDNYREGTVNWEETKTNIAKTCVNGGIYISQGFIGANESNNTVSLGREGSDFSAAIFAYSLDAESVTIWKDVAGMLNADPKFYPNATRLAQISYHEAIELSYYGASVIHPKTIKPLQNKKIPLYVKSFLNPSGEGSIIQESTQYDTVLPSFIFIEDQILLSISPRDFSFIAEGNIGSIFRVIANLGIKVNLIQNSALSFSVCIKNDERKVPKLIVELSKEYKVLFNDKVTLFTVRHYDDATIKKVVGNSEILLEQRTRNTARFVLNS